MEGQGHCAKEYDSCTTEGRKMLCEPSTQGSEIKRKELSASFSQDIPYWPSLSRRILQTSQGVVSCSSQGSSLPPTSRRALNHAPPPSYPQPKYFLFPILARRRKNPSSTILIYGSTLSPVIGENKVKISFLLYCAIDILNPERHSGFSLQWFVAYLAFWGEFPLSLRRYY